jgi:hypothetical protein
MSPSESAVCFFFHSVERFFFAPRARSFDFTA